MAKPTKKSKKKPRAAAKPASVTLLIGTRKGAFFLKSDGTRKGWKIEGPHHFGAIVHHVVLDPRDKKTLLCAARTGHLGPTVFRSLDRGKTWAEASRPPAFKKAEDKSGRVVDHVFWLTPGHPSEPGVWYAGTSPQGLFRSADGGATWDGVDGFNDHPLREKWTGGEKDATPDGPKMHSVIVDPRDPLHLYIGMSSGGFFESTDRGAEWRPLNKGVALDFYPEELKHQEYGHDPHCVMMCPTNPDRLYRQDHCGIYRLDRPGDAWERIGRAMPAGIGDIGFPVVVHPRNADAAWVVPMDGTAVWPRTSVGGRPAVFGTRDAGRSWKRLDRGMPREHAWWTVKRQAFSCDAREPVGLYFGTTSGEIWASTDEGKSWKAIAHHLPHVYSVTIA